MPNQKNLTKVENLEDKISKAKTVLFADYTGLSSNQMNALRTKIRQNSGETTIGKNTLTKIAFKNQKLDTKETTKQLEGQVALIFGYDDAISVIKAVFEFIKEVQLPKIKAGIIDGIFTSGAKVETLSNLPSREQLLSQVTGSLRSPISNFANILVGPQRKLVYALAAMANKREKEVH
jgi:large subunit ribosomal protein L10